jgi:hypothetical protein
MKILKRREFSNRQLLAVHQAFTSTNHYELKNVSDISELNSLNFMLEERLRNGQSS